MSLSSEWQEKLKKIQECEYSKKRQTFAVISPAQFIFNPLEASEVVVSAEDQYPTPAELYLSARNSSLKMSVTSSSLQILSLYGNAQAIGEGVVITSTTEDKTYSCVVRTYHNMVPTNDINLWILLPKLQPSLDKPISFAYSKEDQQVYDLYFKVLPDEQDNLAYFGDCAVNMLPDELVKILMGIK